MSETPHNPESARERFMSLETLTDVQGKIDRMVLEDPHRTDLGNSIIATHKMIKDNIEEILAIRWNKDESDTGENPVHAIVKLHVGPVGGIVTSEVYSIGTTPETCWSEFELGADSYRMPVDERSAKDLIAKLHSFLPATGM
jgi:hypothetical protein